MFCSTQSCSSESNQMSDVPETKPEVCKFFRDGKCRNGDSCRFSHDTSSTSKEGEHESVANPDTGTGLASTQDSSQLDTKPETNNASANSEKKTFCKFYAKGYCRGGNKCTFLHERPTKKSSKKGATSVTARAPKQSGDKSSEKAAAATPPQELSPKKTAQQQGDGKKQARVCHFLKSGHCKKGDDCQFRHPGYKKTEADDGSAITAEPTKEPVEGAPAEEKPSEDKKTSEATTPDAEDSSNSDKAPYERPSFEVRTSMKMAEVTDVGMKQMRETEIKQFKVRYPEAQLEKHERVETYRIIVNPTDPDWPYDMRDFELLISFPVNYPLVPFLVDMPEDQDLPESVMDSMTPKMQEWVSAKHATNEVANKVELIIRPFLRWLDKKLETLFTDAARRFKKHVDAKKAGFEFIAHTPTQKSPEEKQFDVPQPAIDDDEATDDTLGDVQSDEPSDESPSSPSKSLSKSSNYEAPNGNRRGTEVLLRGLQLNESIGTLVCQTLSISIQCSRCKNRCEITTPARRANVVKCTKCQHQMSVIFRPSLAHKFSSTMGFLDLEGCTPFDLVLMDCEFAAGCINCPKELNLKELHPGQTKTTWCENCHQKIELAIESTKFQKHMPSEALDSSKAHVIDLKPTRKPTKDPAIQEGKPLPDNGTCKHYKKSFRWLRFPCCGKTYPCDKCHDENEPDHEMKYAVRMICGFCCKEQPFTTGKPCISCSNMTTKGKTQHWEGGKGCRDKNKMSKNDKQKYQNSKAKTVSKHAQKNEAQKNGKPTKK